MPSTFRVRCQYGPCRRGGSATHRQPALPQRWLRNARLLLATGSYRRLSKTFHGSARQADDALRDRIDELALNRETVGSTFEQLLDAWLGECERLERSPTTMRTYRA